VLHLTSNTN